MNATTVFITAGTNVGAERMSAEDSRALANAIRAAIADNGGTVFFAGVGEGTWEGITEYSYAFGATFSPNRYLHTHEQLDGIRADLVLIARRFHQDAIGVTIHDPANYGESYVTA